MASLVVEGVTKRFGGLVAVDDVSLAAEPGGITALIGPNGAGKTTLFNIITGFEAPDAGTIALDDRRIEGLPAWKIAQMGLVRTFQTPIGFPKLSVWENLMVAGSDARAEGVLAAFAGRRAWGRRQSEVGRRADELMKDLGLSHRRDDLVENLSPGETKLVEFARQLMARPHTLLLDEPASGVNPRDLGRLASLIRRVKERGIGVVVIDHNLSFIMSIAQHVYVLANGRVLTDGAPAEVSQDPRVIETYLGSSG